MKQPTQQGVIQRNGPRTSPSDFFLFAQLLFPVHFAAHTMQVGSCAGMSLPSMAEIIRCPSCRRKLQAPEALAGQDVQCPTCGATFVAVMEGNQPIFVPPIFPTSSDQTGPNPSRKGPDWEQLGYRRRDLLPHRGQLILVLGILSCTLVLAPVLGPIAWVMGQQDLTEISAGRMDPDGENVTNTGRICGMVSTLVAAVVFLLFCVLVSLP